MSRRAARGFSTAWAKAVGAVLDVGQWQPSRRAEDQVPTPKLLAEACQIFMVASPDEPGPEDRQVPVVFLAEALGNPLLPGLGDGVAVAVVEVGLQGRFFGQGALDVAPAIDGEAAGQHQLRVADRAMASRSRSVPTTVSAI